MASTIEIFCCYAREDQPLLQKLKTHLMPLQWQGLITIWSDTNINAGEDWEQEINKHLDTAHIILLLVSSDFMASEYCYSKEMKRAMERHGRSQAHVIPILLRPTYWKGAPFAKLQALPTNAKPVTDRSWTEDEALYDVAEQISTVVKELRIQNYVLDADQLSHEQRFEEALVIYDQLLQLEPQYASAYLKKGEVLIALERFEESLAFFDTAIRTDPTVADIHFYESKAFALSALQRYEESLAAYDAAIRLKPLALSNYEMKARILLHLHRFLEALATYEQLIHLEPNRAEHFQDKGDLLRQLGRATEALEAYDRALLLDPKEATTHAKKGELLLGLKRHQEALESYEHALDLEPEQAQHYQQKGELLLGLNRFEDALEAYETAIRLAANAGPYPYHGKGQALFGLARYEEALVAYEQALHLDDPHPDPQFYHDKGVIHEYLAKQAYQREKEARLHWKPRGEVVSPMHFPIRAEAFTLLHTLTSHTDYVRGLALSPDGQVLASGSEDTTIKLWDMHTGQELRTLTGHTSRVCALALSSDGQVLASGSSDQTIKLWDMHTGQELRTLTDHTSPVWDLAFTPDGQVLASGSDDKTIKLWGIP